MCRKSLSEIVKSVWWGNAANSLAWLGQTSRLRAIKTDPLEAGLWRCGRGESLSLPTSLGLLSVGVEILFGTVDDP